MRLAAADVTFNRPDGVRRVVGALAAQTLPLDEVIVVNNGEPVTVDGAVTAVAG